MQKTVARPLTPERDVEARLLSPAHLIVADRESLQRDAESRESATACRKVTELKKTHRNGARKVDERRNLSRSRGVAVEDVGGDGDTGDHDSNNVHSPANDDSGNVELEVEGLADDDESRDHQEGGDEEDEETALGHEDSLVAASVPVCHGVVGPVAEHLSDPEGDQRSGVETRNLGEGESVTAGLLGGGEEDRGGDVDADSPHEGERVDDENHPDDGLEANLAEAEAGGGNRGLVLTLLEGGNSYELLDASDDTNLTNGLDGEGAIVPRLVGEEDDGEEDGDREGEDEPEDGAPLSIEPVDHESWGEGGESQQRLVRW